MFEYYHDGATWGIDIPALSIEDAQARINKMCFAKYLGEHYCTIKASPANGLLVRLICFVKNIFERAKGQGAQERT
jgi:hypothetical protein